MARSGRGCRLPDPRARRRHRRRRECRCRPLTGGASARGPHPRRCRRARSPRRRPPTALRCRCTVHPTRHPNRHPNRHRSNTGQTKSVRAASGSANASARRVESLRSGPAAGVVVVRIMGRRGVDETGQHERRVADLDREGVPPWMTGSRRAEALDEGDGTGAGAGAHAQSGATGEEGGDRPVDDGKDLGEDRGARRSGRFSARLSEPARKDWRSPPPSGAAKPPRSSIVVLATTELLCRLALEHDAVGAVSVRRNAEHPPSPSVLLPESARLQGCNPLTGSNSV